MCTSCKFSLRWLKGRSAKSAILKKWLLSAGTGIFLVFSLARIAGAINSNYNRPHPLMDYAPQELGIYDTRYENLTETDCRSCHGNSLAERHHATPLAVQEQRCIVCHEVSPGAPSGVSVIRDCTTSGCHSSQDLDTNGWHHNTDMSGSSNCVACHSPDLIAEITPVRDMSMYPPSVVTPTPFSCENCHWEQTASVTKDPQSPGHPSTQEHFNEHGEYIGFYEYGKPVCANYDTHHMNFQGNMAYNCYRCHSQNPNNPNWDPFDPHLIRYCEICHSISTLHRIGPHVQNTNGWRAKGFHVSSSDDPDDYFDVDPTEYGQFTADQQCMGCHADLFGVALPEPPTPPAAPPALDEEAIGIQPSHGCCGTVVTLRGANFGEQRGEGYAVQLDVDGEWTDMPVHAWTDNLIEFEVPCWSPLVAGNFDVQVVTPTGESNHRVFTLENCAPPILTSAPEAGTCGTWITVSFEDYGIGSFGDTRTEMFDDNYHGVCRLVDFSSSQGMYTALDYRNWSNESFEVRVYDFYKDRADDETGGRNYVQDLDEPVNLKCSDMALGKWAVYVKYIFFGDEDADGVLSEGDTIFQVMTSDPLYFELTKTPVIYRLTPFRILNDNVVRIYGLNFGPTQESGEVRIGSLEDAQSPSLGMGILLENIRGWSSTMVKIKMENLPPEWSGQYLYMWVEKGVKSNVKKIKVL
ncbi:MAG: hypothetical protein AB1847_06080 [bacterium]